VAWDSAVRHAEIIDPREKMNRIPVPILLTVLLTACVAGVTKAPLAAPSLTPSPTPSPTAAATLAVPSATSIPSLMPAPTVTPACEPIKIMPLGDSITYGEGIVSYGGYRNLLGALLESEGVLFDFVGSQRSGAESIADADNEGHSGWTTSYLRMGIDTQGWLETYQPHLILLHIGTNDLRDGHPLYAAQDLSALLDDILTRLPDTQVIVARIIRTRWGTDTKHVDFNNAIPELVTAKGAQVSMVDMQDILSKGDLISLFHPSPRGYDKMAHAWMTAILALDLGKCAGP